MTGGPAVGRHVLPALPHGPASRLPEGAHTGRPWRIHEIAPDFRVEDVWALPAAGGPGEFGRLVEMVTCYDTSRTSAATRALFAVRWKLGALCGWDTPGAGGWTPTLRDRLPADLREHPPADPALNGFPFTPLFSTDDEWAAEIANRTVHGVLHLGWIPRSDGRYRGQLTVLVKPHGLLGEAYLAAIRPFRYFIVYPAITRELGRAWATDPGTATHQTAAK